MKMDTSKISISICSSDNGNAKAIDTVSVKDTVESS